MCRKETVSLRGDADNECEPSAFSPEAETDNESNGSPKGEPDSKDGTQQSRFWGVIANLDVRNIGRNMIKATFVKRWS